jgi:hypothetical protein
MPETALDQYRRVTLKGQPHFFEFLSRREFQLAYAVAAVSRFTEYQAAFDLAPYATPGADEGTWEEQIRRAIRYLADRGLTFNGIELDGWEIRGLRVVEPRNLAYVVRFKMGSMPDLIEALESSVEALEAIGLEGEADTLRDALETVREEKQKALAEREMEVM